MTIIGGVLIIVVIVVFCYSCSYGVTRKLLSENRVYHWKVYHVTERDFNTGTDHYFEVYYGEQKLVLPKEMTGGLRDVSRFHAAGGFNSGETNYDSVLIIFEAFSEDQRGFEQRNLVSVIVRPEPGQTGKITIANLCTGRIAELIPE